MYLEVGTVVFRKKKGKHSECSLAYLDIMAKIT